MILADILARAVAADEPVLADFIATMGGPFIRQHSLVPAKGSSRLYLNKNHDQSMLAHVFNGLFPAMRLLALADRSRPRPFLSDLGQRLYVLGYAMHDLNKIRDLNGELDTSNRASVLKAREMLKSELESLNVAAFLPQYDAYLDDILFLVVNTQRSEGANLSLFHFPGLQLDERELFDACDLCRYSDALAFFVKRPAEVLCGEARYKEARERIKYSIRKFGAGRFKLVYHQFADTRGLLTGVINNAVKDLFVYTLGAHGEPAFAPYLFFPDGVVYIQTDLQAQPDLDPASIWSAVERRLGEACVGSIDESTPGFGFNNKSNLTVPGYFRELLSPEALAGLLAKACLRTRANVTASTQAKMRDFAAAGIMPPEADLDYPAEDARSAIVGRFLLNFEKLISDEVTSPADRAVLDRLLQVHFGLADIWPIALRIPSSGGLDYRYFWLGARFMLRQPTLAAEGEDAGSLAAFMSDFVAAAAPIFGPALRRRWQGELLPQLRRYVEGNLSFGVQGAGPTPAIPDFAAAFASYVSAKQSRQATLPCTVCNSPYLIGHKQADAEVLFQPWVYKNRLPLNAGENAGGICAICLLEMMLRQLRQSGESRRTGKKFEDEQIKFFYLYPSYFFTTETATLVQTIVNNLNTFSIGDLVKSLSDRAIEAADYLHLGLFNINPAYGEFTPRYGYYNMDYDDRDVPGMIFFGHRALSREPTASETWAVPALLGLMLPIALGCKVVVADSYLPLYGSGEEFKETVVLEAPHPFLYHLLTGETENTDRATPRQKVGRELRMSPPGRIRIDRVLETLRVLTRVYSINYETYGEPRDPHWSMVGKVARAIRADPLNVFRFLLMQAREDKAESLAERYWPRQTQRYMIAYEDVWNGLGSVIGGVNPMEIIRGLVERYAKFYRPDFKSASIVRPVDIAARLVLSYRQGAGQEPGEYAADLKLIMQGELARWLDRLRNGEGSGRARFYGKAVSEQEAPAISAFVEFFYHELFLTYCRGETGILRTRLNNIKSGCEAYFTLNRAELTKRVEGAGESGETQETEAPLVS